MRILPNKDIPEHHHQCYFVTWWRRSRKETIYATPNGGKRGKREAGRLKAEGVLAGVWDLYVPAFCLYIEMKTLKGRLSPEQKQFRARILEENPSYTFIVANGCKDAIQKAKEFLATIDKP